MGKAARLKRERRLQRAQQGKIALEHVRLDEDMTFSGTYWHKDVSGATIEFAYEDDSVYVGVIDPVHLVKPRSSDEREKLQACVDAIDEKVTKAVPSFAECVTKGIRDATRSHIWQDDMLRKYVSEYRVFVDVEEDDEGDEHLEYNLAFTISVAPSRLITAWYDGVLDGMCMRDVTDIKLSDMADELCPHCARRAGKLALMTQEEIEASGERASALIAKLDEVAAKLREEVPLEVFPSLVRFLRFEWKTYFDGTWTEHSLIDNDGDEELPVEPDDRIVDIGDWSTIRHYEYEEKRDSRVPLPRLDDIEWKGSTGELRCEDGSDVAIHAKKRDISDEIGKMTTGGGKWEVPRNYYDIEHGTVYLLADKEKRIGRGMTRVVLTDSVDELAMVIDEGGGQTVEDRSVFDVEDPSELQRFAMKCEEISHNGELDAYDARMRDEGR